MAGVIGMLRMLMPCGVRRCLNMLAMGLGHLVPRVASHVVPGVGIVHAVIHRVLVSLLMVGGMGCIWIVIMLRIRH
jgi:hypothetical protein